MTTERSGMSLERAIEVMDSLVGSCLNDKSPWTVIKAHLSRDAVVSYPISDAECRKFANALFGPGASDNWIPTIRTALSSFAARHAAVPDRFCKGTNCTSVDGTNHSPECIAEHQAAVRGEKK